MNFLYPLFLVASLVIVIPIIIHLFNFKKYKKVFFPDIRFLKELHEQTQKHSKLKHLLILASRILALAALVLAFAQPFFNKDKDKMSQVPKTVSVYIDNSYSMGIEKNSLSMLDVAKGKAKQIIESLNANDKLQILTNDFGFNENKFLDKNEGLLLLSNIKLSAKNKTANQILEKQKILLNTESAYQKQIVFVSDFQKNNFASNITTNDSIKKYFVSVQANNTNNIYIDTVFLEQSSLVINEENKINVKMVNTGEEEVNTSLTLHVNNQLKSVVNANLKPNTTQLQSISYTPNNAGTQNIKLYINDYPMTFDDTFYVAGKVNANYAVLILNQNNANAYLSSVFKPNNQFKVDNFQISNVNIGLLKNYSLIILNGISSMSNPVNEALNQYINHGGNILSFAPSNTIGVSGINSFLSKSAGCIYTQFDTARMTVSSYNKSNDLFRDLFVKTPENIDLPTVYKRYFIDANALSSEQKLFSFSNGEAFLSEFSVGNGKLFVCASSAESNASTFPKSYWFLPLIYKMAYSNQTNNLNALSINKNNTLLIENNKMNDKTIYHIEGNGIDAIPEQRAVGNKMLININNAIENAGFYAIKLPNATDSTSVAVNYDRSESVLKYWDMSELKKSSKLKNAEWMNEKNFESGTISELQHGMPLWKICIILALLFLIIEILLIRLLK